jgi:2,3-bisphosphoglycerate-independent phosphoglycerate mutase
VLEALGIDFDLQANDIAARGNFCTLDNQGRISDRRAGRVASGRAAALCEKLAAVNVPGAEIFVEPVREHRFVLVLRPADNTALSDQVADTDPQREGVPPLEARALAPEAEPTADMVRTFAARASSLLRMESPANGLTLRGFASRPTFPCFPDVTGMRAAAVAAYPMYRGLAKLVGMTVLKTGTTYEDEIDTVRKHWDEFDFFFIHYKAADTAGEDGDFDAKMAALQAFDQHVLALHDLGADVLLIAGDHSTPATMAAHSWHPVPFLLHGPHLRPDDVRDFDEKSCLHGALGIFPAKEALALAMAHAGRLTKYGA